MTLPPPLPDPVSSSSCWWKKSDRGRGTTKPMPSEEKEQEDPEQTVCAPSYTRLENKHLLCTALNYRKSTNALVAGVVERGGRHCSNKFTYSHATKPWSPWWRNASTKSPAPFAACATYDQAPPPEGGGIMERPTGKFFSEK